MIDLKKGILTSIGILIILFSGCAPQAAEDKSLKIGTLPIIDVLPMWVAEEKDIFKEHGLQVELVPFASAVERDAAIQAGQIDGQLNDLISAGLLNKDSEFIKIVRQTYKATPNKAMISILAAPASQVKNVKDLKGAEIAVSQNTVIEYVTDQLLISQGIKPSEVKKTEISKIPVRLEMLTKNQVPAATLPDPFAALAAQMGAKVIIDDSEGQIGQSVLTFRQEIITKKSSLIKHFLMAYEQSVTIINSNPEQYRALLVDKAKVPEAIKDFFIMPAFPKAAVPKEQEVERAVNWMAEKGLIPRPIPYAKLVDATLLPK